MVYPDLSFEPSSKSPVSARLAPVPDRLLAFLIDFLLFTPIAGLITAGVLRELRASLILGVETSESWTLWFSLLFSWSILAILFESLSVYLWKGTPGQRFVKIEVRSIRDGAPLDLGQSLARSAVHFVSLVLVLPMLAVYTHPLRRALHDRAFDTILVTLKKSGDVSPLSFERNFFHSWSRMMALIAVFVLVAVTTSVRRQLDVEGLAAANKGLPWCEDLEKSWQGRERLDRAIALYISGVITGACLEKEANLVLWKQQGEARDFGQLAKGLLALESGEGQENLKEVCLSSPEGEACAIANFSRSEEEDRAKTLRKSGLGSFTARLLLLKESVERNHFASAAALIADLRQEALFDPYLAREEIRNIWKMQQHLAKTGREPASDELQKILKSFEERYELP